MTGVEPIQELEHGAELDASQLMVFAVPRTYIFLSPSQG